LPLGDRKLSIEISIHTMFEGITVEEHHVGTTHWVAFNTGGQSRFVIFADEDQVSILADAFRRAWPTLTSSSPYRARISPDPEPLVDESDPIPF
jgi:hypothetical protein